MNAHGSQLSNRSINYPNYNKRIYETESVTRVVKMRPETRFPKCLQPAKQTRRHRCCRHQIFGDGSSHTISDDSYHHTYAANTFYSALRTPCK